MTRASDAGGKQGCGMDAQGSNACPMAVGGKCLPCVLIEVPYIPLLHKSPLSATAWLCSAAPNITQLASSHPVYSSLVLSPHRPCSPAFTYSQEQGRLMVGQASSCVLLAQRPGHGLGPPARHIQITWVWLPFPKL